MQPHLANDYPERAHQKLCLYPIITIVNRLQGEQIRHAKHAWKNPPQGGSRQPPVPRKKAYPLYRFTMQGSAKHYASKLVDQLDDAQFPGDILLVHCTIVVSHNNYNGNEDDFDDDTITL